MLDSPRPLDPLHCLTVSSTLAAQHSHPLLAKYSDMSRAICLFHCIFLHTPNLVVYCLLITIALDRLSHVSVRLTIVAYHWIDCPYHWIDCRMCQFGLRLSQNTGSILAYHWISCRLARVVACEYSRIASYLYILGIRVVRIGSKSLPTPPDRWRKLMCSMLTNFIKSV